MDDWIWRVIFDPAIVRGGECVLVVCKRGKAAFRTYHGEVAPSARISMTHALRDTPMTEGVLPLLSAEAVASLKPRPGDDVSMDNWYGNGDAANFPER